MLASKSLPRIKFYDSRGRPKKELETEEEQWLQDFLDRPDISRQTPGRKDTVYIGKVNGERQYKQKRYLQWTLREILDIVNGSSQVQQTVEESFPARFNSKVVTFRMLYNFIKVHKEYKFQRDTPHESCTCEICENVHLFVMSINRNLKKIDKRLPTNVKEFSCDLENVKCMKSKPGKLLRIVL
eukprot:TCONS_00022348-protein